MIILLHIIILSFVTLSISDINNNNNQSYRVNIYHFTINYWAESIYGNVKCDNNIICNWAYSRLLIKKERAIHMSNRQN